MSEHNLLQFAFIIMVALVICIIFLARESRMYREKLKHISIELAKRSVEVESDMHSIRVEVQRILDDAQA